MFWIDQIGNAASLIGALLALMAWIQSRSVRKRIDAEKFKKSRKIVVVLQHGSEKLELPVELRRSELTRAEILGRIGMIPTKTKNGRFTLGYLNTKEFLEQVNKLNEGDSEGLLTIPCKLDEYQQFDIID
jgi:hypothetical protein